MPSPSTRTVAFLNMQWESRESWILVRQGWEDAPRERKEAAPPSCHSSAHQTSHKLHTPFHLECGGPTRAEWYRIPSILAASSHARPPQTHQKSLTAERTDSLGETKKPVRKRPMSNTQDALRYLSSIERISLFDGSGRGRIGQGQRSPGTTRATMRQQCVAHTHLNAPPPSMVHPKLGEKQHEGPGNKSSKASLQL